MNTDMVIVIGDHGDLKKAEGLSVRLGIPAGKEKPREGLFLMLDETGLSLSDGKLSLQGDFRKMMPRLRKSNLSRELLVRSAKLKHHGGMRAPRLSNGSENGALQLKNREGSNEAQWKYNEKDRSAESKIHENRFEKPEVPELQNVQEFPVVMDTTAGLGEDSLLLAASGYSVLLYEHNPVIAALLQDALERAGRIPELEETVSRMKLVPSDSLSVLRYLYNNEGQAGDFPFSQNCIQKPDIIFLDPMFPPRQKSALVKKKLQLIQKLEMPEGNGEELLAAALLVKPRKVIVKRPLKGPYLAGKKPGYSLKGKAVRYDCYLP